MQSQSKLFFWSGFEAAIDLVRAYVPAEVLATLSAKVELADESKRLTIAQLAEFVASNGGRANYAELMAGPFSGVDAEFCNSAMQQLLNSGQAVLEELVLCGPRLSNYYGRSMEMMLLVYPEPSVVPVPYFAQSCCGSCSERKSPVTRSMEPPTLPSDSTQSWLPESLYLRTTCSKPEWTRSTQ